MVFASLSILLFACQKELSLETGTQGNTESTWEFKESATSLKGSIDTAYLEESGGFQTLVFEGPSSDGKGQLFMQVFGTNISVGSYTNPNVFFEYSENASILFSNVPTNADKFTVIITSFDSNAVSGTFSGEVENNAGEVKTVVEGKFTAVLIKSTPPPLQGICKLRNIGLLDIGSGKGWASITNSFNSSNQVSRVQNVDSVNNVIIDNFNLVYSATRVTLDTAQYFDLDASGRIKEFHGYLDADVASGNSPKVIIRYTFDANGYMTKAAYSLPSFPTLVVQEINFTWTNGNLTKVTISEPNSLAKVEIVYTYDVTKSPKEFLCLFPNYEIVYMQTAVNYGKNSVNLPTKSTITEFDATTGQPNTPEVSDFKAYQLNSENYVTSFVIEGEGSVLPGNTRYALSYKCY